MFFLDKHLGEYTACEIPLGNVLKLNLGRWEKALFEDTQQ